MDYVWATKVGEDIRGIDAALASLNTPTAILSGLQ